MYFNTIDQAREALQLPKHATMDQIKKQYKSLIKRWHPDKCNEAPERCEAMARRITDAYRIILNYCNSYQYSFERDEVKKHVSESEWWLQRFGSDPMWGV